MISPIHDFNDPDILPPRRRHPWLRAAILAIACGLLVGVGVARAEDEPRFEPTARGADAVERWRPLVSQYEWDADTALAVIRCESEGKPTAVNPTSGAQGLFQLLGWDRFAARLFGRWVSLADPDVNTRVAWALYVDSGYRWGFHWAASRSCWGGW